MVASPEHQRENAMPFTPLHDRVLVRRIEGEEKTKGGLIIPDTAKEKPAEGEVVGAGKVGRKVWRNGRETGPDNPGCNKVPPSTRR